MATAAVCQKDQLSDIGNVKSANLNCLMYLNHVALGVVEKDLVPLFCEGSPVVRVRNPVVVQKGFECFDVVGSERNVTAFHRVDHLAIFERNVQVSFGEMHLHIPVCRKPYMAAISCILCLIRARKVLYWNVVQPKHLGIKPMQSGDVVRDIVDVVKL